MTLQNSDPKMTGEPASKKEAPLPKPPERSFYDKPKKTLTDWIRAGAGKILVFTWKKKIWVIAIAVVLIFFAWIGKGTDPETKKTESFVQTEEQKVITSSAIEEAIQHSEESLMAVKAPEKKKTVPDKTHIDSSPMAVYVRKEEPQNLRLDPAKEDIPGLPSGAKIPAFIPSRIFSFNVEAPVFASTAKDIYWKQKIVIPKGSQFLGSAGILKSLDRINVNFTKLVLPDGKEIRVRAMALSQDGSAGIRGKVEKHQDLKIFKALGETILGAGALFTGTLRQDPFSLEDQLRLNAAQNLTNQARDDLRSVRIDTSITVDAYTPIEVLLLEAL
ncbi:MAG: hypothetical protein HY586_01615 [Candidatus Omnitrophica bacterium]|nr:hypothetical protein [Candidatus Omnitrophota bacterium]